MVSDILIRFCERIPYAFVILWAMNHAGLSAQQFGVLVALEMVTAMVCYIPVAHLADKYGRRPFVLITFIFFTLFPISLIWANSFGALAFAFMVRGLKEFGEPATEGSDHWGSSSGASRSDLWGLLPHSGLHRDHRLLPGRLAVEHFSQGQLHRSSDLRRTGHNLVLVVRLAPGYQIDGLLAALKIAASK